jgi:hypothetical protein
MAVRGQARIRVGILACAVAVAAGCARPGAATADAAPARDLPDRLVTHACADLRVQVRTRSKDGVALACDGARDALTFLDWLPRPAAPVMLVELVDRLPAGLRDDAVGCYATQSRRLMVLELPLFMARGRWFGVPVSSRLYRAVVAHEVAHALVGCHLQGRPLPNAAHEYVAYVVLFATLDEATRSAALAAMPGPGFEHDAEINDFQYAFDPMSFGVQSYRHWLRQPDGVGFLRDVVRGAIVPDLNL